MSRGRTLILFAFVTLIWGSTWLVIKGQVGASIQTPPEWGIAWRFLLSGGVLLAWLGLRGQSLWLPREGRWMALLGGTSQFCLNYMFVYHGEQFIPSGLSAVIYALLMVPNALFSRLVLGTPLRPRFMAGSGIAMVGVALLMVQEYTGGGAKALLGVGLTLCGLICASVANVAQASEAARSQPVLVLAGRSMAVGALLDCAIAFALRGPPVIEPSWHYWGGVAYLGLAGTVLTFPLYFMLIRSMGAGRAAFTGVAIPVVAMALSTLFEDYRWTTLAAAGSALAMVGMMIALSPSRKVG